MSTLSGLPTGFKDFDRVTGGLRPGELLLVAGASAMGKSTFAVNIAENTTLSPRSRASVAIFSLEMPAEQVVTRMLASIARVSLENLRSGRLQPEDWHRIAAAQRLLSEAKIFVDETPSLTTTELSARARRMQQEHGLDLIIVDCLQLMQVPDNRKSRAAEMAEIGRTLKAVAQELSVSVIALSQLSAGVEERENKRPVLSDLPGSGALERDADMILLIHREEVHDRNTPRQGLAEMDLVKHRNGEKSRFVLAFQGRFMRFQNVAPGPTGT